MNSKDDDASSFTLPSYGGVWNSEPTIGTDRMTSDDPEELQQNQPHQPQPPPRHSSVPAYPEWSDTQQEQEEDVHSEERTPLHSSTTIPKSRTRRRRRSDPSVHGVDNNKQNGQQQRVRFENNHEVLHISNRTSSSIRGSHNSNSSTYNEDSIFPTFHHHWLPDKYETEDEFATTAEAATITSPSSRHSHYHSKQSPPPPIMRRSWKRRVFLFLTEPATSIASAIFFFVLIFAIALMNIVMIMQTMTHWQYTPDDCITCGGDVVYVFEDDTVNEALVFDTTTPINVPCVCPPTPNEWTNAVLKNLIYFFTVEWILRVVFFEPPQEHYTNHSTRDDTTASHASVTDQTLFWRLWFSHLTDTTTILDALAIFPFYLESLENTNGLMSLRLLRLFRVFQLLRLGQYNTTFLSLTSVLRQSMIYLKLLMVVLIFGAALFGSLMYWLEKGSWQYHHDSASYRFVRLGVDGVTEEPSPFTSIPAAFWWFMVTATTVGYGDVYPTTVAGKWVATCAMLTGVLVVAFPVSVFSDLWQKEVRKMARDRRILLPDYDNDDDDDENVDDGDNSMGDGNYDQDDIRDSLVAKGSADSGTNPGSETEDSVYYSSRAKEFDTLLSNMSLSRLITPVPEKTAHAQESTSQYQKSPLNSSNKGMEQVDRTKVSGSAMNNDVVAIEKDDFAEIMNRLEIIRQNEIRIQGLMKKYQL